MFKGDLNYSWSKARYTVGSNMVVWPPYTPKLAITMVGGEAVDPDGPAVLETAEGAEPVAVAVEVSATGFPPGTLVAYATVKLTPENESGSRYEVDLPLDGTAGDGTKQGTATMMVDFPPGKLSRLDAWLRPPPAP